jgi:hypothetical protein
MARRSSYGLSLGVASRDGRTRGRLGVGVAAPERGGGDGRGFRLKVRLEGGRAGVGSGLAAVRDGIGTEAATARGSGAPSHRGPDGSGRTSECINQSAPPAMTPTHDNAASIAFIEMAPGCAAKRVTCGEGSLSLVAIWREDGGDASRREASGNLGLGPMSVVTICVPAPQETSQCGRMGLDGGALAAGSERLHIRGGWDRSTPRRVTARSRAPRVS